MQTQLVLFSGMTGVQIGSTVVLNTLTANHLLHRSASGSHYVLLQTGLCPKTLSHDNLKEFWLRKYTKYCKSLGQKCIKSYKTYIHLTWNYKDRLGYLDAHARMLFVPDTTASASSQKPACTDWLCGGSLLKPNQGWRRTSKGTKGGRWMPVKHLGLYQSMSKTQPSSIHRAHVCLSIAFNKTCLPAQIWLFETRAESGAKWWNLRPAASHWEGGGTNRWENITITVGIQHQLSLQVFFKFHVMYNLIWL